MTYTSDGDLQEGATSSVHLAAKTLPGLSILDVPLEVGDKTNHLVRVEHPIKRNNTEGLLLLSPAGREILAVHVAASSPFLVWPDSFVSEILAFPDMRPPSTLSNWEFHFYNLLLRIRPIALRRSDLTVLSRAFATSFQRHAHPEWFPVVDEDSDVIQHLNKTSQWGVKHHSADLPRYEDGKKKSHYWCEPESSLVRSIRDNFKAKPQVVQPEIPSCKCKGAVLRPASAELLKEVLRVKEHLRRSHIDVDASDWTLNGHRDPTQQDGPLVAQPTSYNRAYKDKYKFDEFGLPEALTVSHLSKGDALLKHYPSSEERVALAKICFESLSPEEAQELAEDLLDGI